MRICNFRAILKPTSHSTAYPILYLLQQIDTHLQVHAKIDERPFDTLSVILFLFQNEHVVVEKLLQLFVGKIDAQLLKTIELSIQQTVYSELIQITSAHKKKNQKKKKRASSANRTSWIRCQRFGKQKY